MVAIDYGIERDKWSETRDGQHYRAVIQLNTQTLNKHESCCFLQVRRKKQLQKTVCEWVIKAPAIYERKPGPWGEDRRAMSWIEAVWMPPLDLFVSLGYFYTVRFLVLFIVLLTCFQLFNDGKRCSCITQYVGEGAVHTPAFPLTLHGFIHHQPL